MHVWRAEQSVAMSGEEEGGGIKSDSRKRERRTPTTDGTAPQAGPEKEEISAKKPRVAEDQESAEASEAAFEEQRVEDSEEERRLPSLSSISNLLPWADQQVTQLQKALDAFFSEQRLAVRFLAVGSAFDPTQETTDEPGLLSAAVDSKNNGCDKKGETDGKPHDSKCDETLPSSAASLSEPILTEETTQSSASPSCNGKGGSATKEAALRQEEEEEEEAIEREVQRRIDALRDQQLENLCHYLPSRVLDNLSFFKSEGNRDRSLRNSALPLPLRPTNSATCLSESDLLELEALAEEAASAARTKAQSEGASNGISEEKEEVKSGDERGDEKTALAEEAALAAEEAVFSALAKKTFESLQKQPAEPHRKRLSEMQEGLKDSSFCGFWALVLTDKYRVDAPSSFFEKGAFNRTVATSRRRQTMQNRSSCNAPLSSGPSTQTQLETQSQTQPSSTETDEAARRSTTGSIKRFLVCGALVELLETSERQLHAVWCAPNCSSRTTRLILDAFLRAVVLKAFCFRESKVGEDPPWKSAAPTDEPMAANEEKRSQLHSSPLLFAEFSDIFLWPRQCLFLLAWRSHLRWRQHADVQASEQEVAALQRRLKQKDLKKDERHRRHSAAVKAEAEAFFRAKNCRHANDPLDEDFQERGCKCVSLVEDAERLHEELRELGDTSIAMWKRNSYYALSAQSFLLQIPRRTERPTLRSLLPPRSASLKVDASWEQTEGWLDAIDRLRKEAAEGETPGSEIYEVLPLLPRLLDEAPQSLRREELCDVPLLEALRLHKEFVENFHN